MKRAQLKSRASAETCGAIPSKKDPYGSTPAVWILGAILGTALAVPLLLAADSYVRVATSVAPYGANVVRLERVTITAQRARDARIDRQSTAHPHLDQTLATTTSLGATGTAAGVAGADLR